MVVHLWIFVTTESLSWNTKWPHAKLKLEHTSIIYDAKNQAVELLIAWYAKAHFL